MLSSVIVLEIAREEVKWFIEYNLCFKDRHILIRRNVFQSSLLKPAISLLSWTKYKVMRSLLFNSNRGAIKCFWFYYFFKKIDYPEFVSVCPLKDKVLPFCSAVILWSFFLYLHLLSFSCSPQFPSPYHHHHHLKCLSLWPSLSSLWCSLYTI